MEIALHPTPFRHDYGLLSLRAWSPISSTSGYPAARLRRLLGGTVHPCPVGEEPGTPVSAVPEHCLRKQRRPGHLFGPS
jgi:hypothetical protein